MNLAHRGINLLANVSSPDETMDDDLDLHHFSNVCRLFPLPGVVLFPHSVLPLHIFEPRYRQMTEDALADDKLITIVQLKSPTSPIKGGLGSPQVEEVACLGRIIQHERLADGRFNFLLLGRKRVRLKREISAESKAYRIAEVEVLDDLYNDQDELLESSRSELTTLFRRAFEKHQPVDSDLNALLEKKLPLGVLTDIVAHALGLPAEVKQLLLAEPRVDCRAHSLLEILRQILARNPEGASASKPFPPPFSMN
jgi:Lon protease-like protein